MNKVRYYLFCDGELSTFLQQRHQALHTEIERLKSDYLMKVSVDDLTAHLVDEFTIEPIVLFREAIHVKEGGDTKVDMRHDPRYGFAFIGDGLVPGIFADFAIPFSGDVRLLKLRPDSWNTRIPQGKIMNNELRLRIERPSVEADGIKAEFEDNLINIETHLVCVENQVLVYNEQLPAIARKQIAYWKEKHTRDAGILSSLGYPLKLREGIPPSYAVPIIRKKLPIQRPNVEAGPHKPELALDLETYEHILKVISDVVLVMERSPKTFVKMDEEGLRTHILVQLNGHYEGQATGETFNGDGKTDILIRADGKNIFIGECKFWTGAKVFKETINQLLGYTSWRDSKTALIIFNRNKDTTAVLEQIPDLVKQHPNFKRQITNYNNPAGFRFVLHQRDDTNREFIMTVLVFNVPV